MSGSGALCKCGYPHEDFCGDAEICRNRADEEGMDIRPCANGFHEFSRGADLCQCGRIRIALTPGELLYVDVKPWLDAPAPRRWKVRNDG